MARFKNISGDDRHVGRADGPVVRAGDVTSIDGGVVEELDDAYIVGEGDDARAWPKETWELVSEAKTRKAE
ncbi:hypothetical protein N5079_19805 [Planotetraspora sp. A-T 1434]|uniref:hypothetical protein n=1 Tax=Planotetraspora sp. A-T 1434 TaxID=2979219 RepID=UPI0021C03005|nr:hypothetical protein [Planotetraspora sp. A-T 1434]MCT9932450.1 hypothetical protein [Planotetraspora sp. A-T 1434]